MDGFEVEMYLSLSDGRYRWWNILKLSKSLRTPKKSILITFEQNLSKIMNGWQDGELLTRNNQLLNDSGSYCLILWISLTPTIWLSCNLYHLSHKVHLLLRLTTSDLLLLALDHLYQQPGYFGICRLLDQVIALATDGNLSKLFFYGFYFFLNVDI